MTLQPQMSNNKTRKEMENFLQIFGPQLMIIACIYALVLFVVFLDLWAGIRKAKQRGEYRSSYGLRKTVDKISRYFNLNNS